MKKSIFISVCLLLLLGLGLVGNFVPQAKATNVYELDRNSSFGDLVSLNALTSLAQVYITATSQQSTPNIQINYTLWNPSNNNVIIMERLFYYFYYVWGYFNGATKLYYNITDTINGTATSVLSGYFLSDRIKLIAVTDYSPVGNNTQSSPPTNINGITKGVEYGLGGNKTVRLHLWVDAGNFQFSINAPELDFGYGTASATFQPLLTVFGNGMVIPHFLLYRGGLTSSPFHWALTDSSFTYVYGNNQEFPQHGYTWLGGIWDEHGIYLTTGNPMRFWARLDGLDTEGGFLFFNRIQILWQPTIVDLLEYHATGFYGTERTYWFETPISGQTVSATSRPPTPQGSVTRIIWTPNPNYASVERIVYKTNISFTGASGGFTTLNYAISDNNVDRVVGVVTQNNTWTINVTEYGLGFNPDSSPPPNGWLNDTVKGVDNGFTGSRAIKVFLWGNAGSATVTVNLDFGIGSGVPWIGVQQPILTIWYDGVVEMGLQPMRDRGSTSQLSNIWIGDMHYFYDSWLGNPTSFPTTGLDTSLGDGYMYGRTILASNYPQRVWISGTTNYPAFLGSIVLKFNHPFTSQTVENINKALYVAGNPYIKSATNQISALNCSGWTLTMTIEGVTNSTSTTKVYVGDKGEPKSVSGATNWSYDAPSKILTITVIHSSPANVTVDWRAPTYGDPWFAVTATLVTVGVGATYWFYRRLQKIRKKKVE